jgi:hypothetical protein
MSCVQNKYELNRRIQEYSVRKVPKLIFFSGRVLAWVAILKLVRNIISFIRYKGCQWGT